MPLTKVLGMVVCTMFVGVLLAEVGSAANPQPRRPVPYEQAVTQGWGVEKYFKKPQGIRYCSPIEINFAFAGVAPNAPIPPDDAPECFARPEYQDIRILRNHAAVPPFYPDEGSAGGGYRYAGSRASYYNFEGGSNLSEVSDPSIRHVCDISHQHLYSRIAGLSTGGNAWEIGWVETNCIQDIGDQRLVLTTTYTGPLQDEFFHRNWQLIDGGEHAFRGRQCGPPGDLAICMDIWDGDSWIGIRAFYDVMRCENGDGSGNCRINWVHEMAALDGTSWFDLNGGPDGLRMRNIKVRYGNVWDLFNDGGYTGAWNEEWPYSICRVYAFYHFTTRHGSATC